MLYEKYRPKRFQDVIGQGLNADILRKQVATGRIAHSYLFEGNRGSGKTTSARILAKAVNCEHPVNGEPCGCCASCRAIEEGTSIDVTEIDAASNNGVDNVREIINNMNYKPTGKFKVYIIDEAHMLSNAAANAFLKTLEEPPAFGIFILCTTDAKKLPITILSRCQRFSFARIQVADIVNRLAYINQQENAGLDNNSLNLIAKLADGAMRDALSLMEQVMSNDRRDYNTVVQILGVSSSSICFNVLQALLSRDSKSAISAFYEVLKTGKNIPAFLKELISITRYIMLIKAGATTDIIPMSDVDINQIVQYSNATSFEDVMNIIDILINTESAMKNTSQTAILIEMALVKITTQGMQENVQQNIQTVQQTKSIQPNNQSVLDLDLKELGVELAPEVAETCERLFNEPMSDINTNNNNTDANSNNIVQPQPQQPIQPIFDSEFQRQTKLDIANYCGSQGRQDLQQIIKCAAIYLDEGQTNLNLYCNGENQNADVLRQFEQQTGFLSVAFSKRFNKQINVQIY